jgi:TRAP-type C4-dicarboxylate transport system permease small subunit
MSPPEPPDHHPHDHGTARLARVLALIGGLLLVAIGALVTTSVLMRWLAGGGINGDFELVQMGLAVAVFAFLPLCQAHRGNVMVDTFTSRLSLRAQYLIDALWDLLYGGFAGFIAWRLAIGAMEARTSQTTSMMLGLPIYYAIGLCAAMAAFLAVICVLTAIRRARGHT